MKLIRIGHFRTEVSHRHRRHHDTTHTRICNINMRGYGYVMIIVIALALQQKLHIEVTFFIFVDWPWCDANAGMWVERVTVRSTDCLSLALDSTLFQCISHWAEFDYCQRMISTYRFIIMLSIKCRGYTLLLLSFCICTTISLPIRPDTERKVRP